MAPEQGGREVQSVTIARALETLKQEGSNILLVGEPETGIHDSACDRLRGTDETTARHRLYVRTEKPICSHNYGDTDSSAIEGDSPHLIRRSDTEPVNPDNSSNEVVVGTEVLSRLATQMIETIDDFEHKADGLQPSDLRMCVDSLVPLLEEHDSQNVFRMVHVTTLRVREANGMGHYHLPIDRDHEAVNLLEPLFDAIVEVRSNGDTFEHRWHLRDQRTSSDWVEL